MAPAASRAIFADTVFWLALINPRDAWHRKAVDWAAALTEQLVTTEPVLTEVADALSAVHHRAWAVAAIENVRGDRQITTVPGTGGLFAQGFELFSARSDKAWSLTDCMSFAVMKERGLDRALTADVHFIQAGFRALLRE